MNTLLRPLLILFAALTLVTGAVYPLAVTGIGAWLFPAQVNGSLVTRDGKEATRDGKEATPGGESAGRESQVVGSSLISQSFQDPKYFWGRLSATAPMPNNGAASGGSNLGPLNPALVEAASARIAALKAADPLNQAPIPVDLVTASGSGLDPQISPAAALYQAARVARERGMSPARVAALVRAHIEAPQWGLFGEPRVNVLMLNLALDRAQ